MDDGFYHRDDEAVLGVRVQHDMPLGGQRTRIDLRMA
jgi:hypothetical protein